MFRDMHEIDENFAERGMKAPGQAFSGWLLGKQIEHKEADKMAQIWVTTIPICIN